MKAIERRYEALMDKHGSVSADKERLGKENAELNKVGFIRQLKNVKVFNSLLSRKCIIRRC